MVFALIVEIWASVHGYVPDTEIVISSQFMRNRFRIFPIEDHVRADLYFLCLRYRPRPGKHYLGYGFPFCFSASIFYENSMNFPKRITALACIEYETVI